MKDRPDKPQKKRKIDPITWGFRILFSLIISAFLVGVVSGIIESSDFNIETEINSPFTIGLFIVSVLALNIVFSLIHLFERDKKTK